MSKLLTILAVAAVATAGMALPAAAQTDDSAPSVEVRYDDLNLASSVGRDRLDTRIRSAIRQVCYSEPSPTLRQRVSAQRCEQQAMRSVEPRMAALLNGQSAHMASTRQPINAAP